MKKFSILGVFALSALLASCSPSTKIIGSWSSPEKSPTGYDKVLVTGLTESLVNRQAFEEELANSLTEDGINAESSLRLIPLGSAKTDEGMAKALETIRGAGFDAILTVALLDQTSETRYIPGSTNMYFPMMYGGFYGLYSGYYGYYNPIISSPGYYTTDKSYYIEVNLYDAQTEALVWSSQSETTNPTNLETFAHTFAGVVVDQMIKDGQISSSK